MNYYLLIQNEQKGPYILSQIVSMWQNGAITNEVLYCAEGMTEWRKVVDLIPQSNSGAGTGKTVESGPNFFKQLKPLFFSEIGQLRSHVHKLAICFAISVVVFVSVRFAIQQHSVEALRIPFQGFVPGLITPAPSLWRWTGVVLAFGTTVFFGIAAWKRLHLNLTILYCVALLVSSALSAFRLNSEALLLKAFLAMAEDERKESIEKLKQEAESVFASRHQLEQRLVQGWQGGMEAGKQELFTDFHSFAGTAKTVKINEVKVSWKTGLAEAVTYTINLTLFWDGPVKNGYTTVEFVVDMETAKPISQRVLESNGQTKRPVGTELQR